MWRICVNYFKVFDLFHNIFSFKAQASHRTFRQIQDINSRIQDFHLNSPTIQLTRIKCHLTSTQKIPAQKDLNSVMNRSAKPSSKRFTQFWRFNFLSPSDSFHFLCFIIQQICGSDNITDSSGLHLVSCSSQWLRWHVANQFVEPRHWTLFSCWSSQLRSPSYSAVCQLFSIRILLWWRLELLQLFALD